MDLSFFAKMKGAARACALGLIWAAVAGVASVSAQEDDLTDDAAIAVLEACLDNTTAQAGCIGAAAGLCASTVGRQGGVGICYGLENAYWEGRVAAAMAALTGPGAAAEAFAARVNWPIPQPTLDSVQITFEAYRDAACDMEAAIWGNGSGAGEAWMACRMRVTAQHALRLDAWLESVG